MKQYISPLFFLLMMLSFMSCTGSKSLSERGSRQVYTKNIQLVNNYFLQISRNSSLVVDIKQNDAKSKVYTITQRQNTDKDQAQPQAGYVSIKFISEDKTSVKITNPDYSLRRPKRKKINYQQFIFSRLQEMLKQTQ